MAEDLAEALKKFELTSQEKVNTSIGAEDFRECMEGCKKSLLGKVIGEKQANFSEIKNFVNLRWNCNKSLKIAELGPNMFQFMFDNELEKEKVWGGRPWIFDNQLLLLEQWEEGIEESEEAFKYSRCWVQIWNIPIHWYSKAVGYKIGKVFKEVIEVKVPNTGSKEGKHLKLLVDMDINKPLLRGTTVENNGKMRFQFRYERCPDYCYGCERIGHSENKCFYEKGPGRNEDQYGHWLRANTGKKANLEQSRLAEAGRDSKERIEVVIQKEIEIGKRREEIEPKEKEANDSSNRLLRDRGKIGTVLREIDQILDEDGETWKMENENVEKATEVKEKVQERREKEAQKREEELECKTGKRESERIREWATFSSGLVDVSIQQQELEKDQRIMEIDCYKDPSCSTFLKGQQLRRFKKIKRQQRIPLKGIKINNQVAKGVEKRKFGLRDEEQEERQREEVSWKKRKEDGEDKENFKGKMVEGSSSKESPKAP